MGDLTRDRRPMSEVTRVDFEVEKWMHDDDDQWGAIRKVTVPADELTGEFLNDLEVIFFYGQNDFQERQTYSVSVGDVIRFYNYRFLVCSRGFRLMYPDEKSLGMLATSHKIQANIS